MATSKFLGYLESRKNFTGSAAGLAGLALTFTGLAGAYWPVVVAGLYGAGALLAPPERPDAPDFADPAEQLDELRADFGKLSTYLDEVDLPPAASGRLTELNEVLTALLEPGWVADALTTDPEAVHTLSRAIRQDIPESVDTFVRTRWWTRIQPGTEPPERHLERQLTLLYDEASALATALREAEARRQETHTRYLEDREGR
ncbi:hypothetical protein OIE62_26955 [Streptomyces scopuliridis]|uniref:Uncharacterized protein n=1 Tax=Streptomyces scopuliridis TaxID=452529 RepID=A0ACD4ZJ24_9ACTN|nr:hypothetical protein [Streptomyces scopuliridis]WSB33748.1 hypothetical protein OG949_13275 [Streptomyces scopuliridis]WSB98021.1 hypothetical protein OG835_13985 [Streptomyces scopuliridis]WSC08277.1 hypothetical protein OIE62_26955 [Streptomyces scopuliridis]